MLQSQKNPIKQWNQIVARAWADEEFKNRLILDPAAVLKENGLDFPAGKQVKIVQNTDQVFHFTLPHCPAGELVDEELGQRPEANLSLSGGCFSGGCGGCGWCGGCDAA